jgi:hypothetical protein
VVGVGFGAQDTGRLWVEGAGWTGQSTFGDEGDDFGASSDRYGRND